MRIETRAKRLGRARANLAVRWRGAGRRFVAWAAVAWLSASLPASAAENLNSSAVQTAKRFKFERSRKAEVNYLLFLPKGCEARSGKSWPVILFLHGAGERGTNVWQVAAHGPPKVAAQQPDFPFIVVSPQCPEGQLWSNDVLVELLEEVVRQYPVDPSRVYLTGLSMGGYGAWSLGLSCPERFAAIAPVCGGGDLITILLVSQQPEHAAALKSLAVWAFHGAKDPVVPVRESERMVDFLKQAGLPEVKLTVYPEAGHDAWTETYNNPALYTWLLEHQRKSAGAAGH